VTGIEIAEIGQYFVRWTWDPVENATGYDTDTFLVGTPPGERGSGRVFVEEPSVRLDGFDPGSELEFVVRAARETAGGRIFGPWSDHALAKTWGVPRECTREREYARTFAPLLVNEWDGTPFRFYFDTAFLPEDEREDARHVLETVDRLSDRIEDQIGYSVLEVAGWTEAPARDCGFTYRDWRSTGQIVAYVISEHRVGSQGELVVGLVTAGRACSSIRYWSGDVNIAKDSIIGHEIFHLLGFKHSALPLSNGRPHPSQSPPEEGGVAMSVPLTGGTDPPDLGVTFEDVDALRCIFPR